MFVQGAPVAGSFAAGRAGVVAGGARVGVVGGSGFYGPGFGPGAGYGGYYGGGDACGQACGPAGEACAVSACGPAGCAGCGVGCGGIAGTTLAVVGDGMGDYVATTTYKYVGMGAGNVAVVPIPGPSCNMMWLCCLWLLLIPLLFLPSTTTTTTTTTPPIIITTPPPDLPPPPVITTTPPPDVPPPPGPPGVCKIFGDPHVITFDGSHASFYSMGEYWIVRSETVWIQGRYMPTPVTNGLSVMKEIAVGGPFLKSKDGSENILRISALTATWNGAGILGGFPDTWSNTDPNVEIIYDSSGEMLQASRAGKQMHVVHVKLPLNVELQINRWNEPGEGEYINMKLTMSAQPNQDGHCGNFNGNPGDDTRPLIRSRIGTTGVPQQDLLFRTKTPVTAANRPDLNNCPTEKSLQAKELCQKKSKNGIPNHDCMVDVCFGGPHFAEMTDYDE